VKFEYVGDFVGSGWCLLDFLHLLKDLAVGVGLGVEKEGEKKEMGLFCWFVGGVDGFIR
jgi:hypothetical protein